MKKAFTLVELLVVIAIIAMLMTALVTYFWGGTESARASRCLANLKQLATAAQSYGRDYEHYPLAGSVERMGIDDSRGMQNVVERYNEMPGWISWNSQSAYKSGPQSHIANYGWFTSAYNQDVTARDYCITNGALWRYIQKETSYVCPSHLRCQKLKRTPPNWSYVMNSYFGFDESKGSDFKSTWYWGVRVDTVPRADKILLFAEMQWEDYTGETPNFSQGAGTENDCTLQYRAGDGGESIGFNHKHKNDIEAHVVFADGHTDKIRWPRSGMSKNELRDLTEWLCEGKDVTFNGKRYEELRN